MDITLNLLHAIKYCVENVHGCAKRKKTLNIAVLRCTSNVLGLAKWWDNKEAFKIENPKLAKEFAEIEEMIDGQKAI